MTITPKELYNKLDPFVVERIRSIVRSTSLASTSGTGTDGETLTAIRDAALLTVGNTAALNAERALTATGALSFTDGGANGNYTLALATPGALSVDSASDASTNHTHAITSSDNPGATSALLKSDIAGGLTLVTATATTKVTTPLIDTAADGLTLSPSNGVVTVNSNLTAATSITSPLLNTSSGGLTIAPYNSITSVTGAMVVSTSVQVPLITTADNIDLIINPAGSGAVQFPNDQTLRTSDFDSSFPIEGWQINEHVDIAGKSVLTIGEIQADELSVRVFVADEVRVDRGDEYWTKSYGIVAEEFTTPTSISGTVSVMFEDSPALVGAIFSNNDWVLIRKLEIDSGLTLYSIWGQVSSYVNNSDGTQSWTFTLRSGPTTGEVISKGSLAIDFGASGAALIHLSVIDAAGAPYIKLRKWVTNPYSPSNYTTYLQLGQLGSIGNTYYTPSGYGFYIRSTANESQFIVADDNGLQIRGADFKIYDGSNQTVNIASDDGSVKLGTNIASDSTTNFDFNGTSGALTIKGSLSANDGDVVANDNGLNLVVFSGGSTPDWTDWGKALTFTANPTTPAENNTVAQIYGQKNSTSWGRLTIEARAGTDAGLTDTDIRILANRDDDVDVFAGIVITNDNTSGGDVQIYARNGASVDGNITMFGKTRTGHVVPVSNNTWDLGASDLYYNDAYIRNLHIDTIVGTPSYSHSHAASDITSGTFDLARIPATLTGKDADTLDTYHASSFLLTTGATTGATSQAQTFTNGVILPTIRPSSDSTTAVRIQNAAGSTSVATVDTTNTRFGVGGTPTTTFHVASGTGALFERSSGSSANLRATGGANPFLQIDNATVIGKLQAIDSVNWFYVGTQSNHETRFITNNTGRGIISAGGLWSIGHLGTATAYADLPAGTTSAASLRVRDGVAPTSPNSGDIWGTGSNLGYRAGSTTYLFGATTNVGTISVASTAVVTTSVSTPSVITASGNLAVTPAGGTTAITGALTVSTTAAVTTSVSTPLVTTASGDLTLAGADDIMLDPASNLVKVTSGVSLQTDNFASQTTGWRATYSGEADFRYLYVDEMHAKSFIADLEQALAGGQIIAKSVTILYSAFTAPAAGATALLVVRDLPSATGMACFVNGDYVRIRTFARSGGSLTIGDCWGTVVLDTSYGTSGFDSSTKTQRYTFTRSANPNAGAMSSGTVVAADSIILDYGTSGNGFYEVNAIDGAYGANSPYSQIVTWSGHPRTQTVRARLGNLYGIWSTSGEYGLYAGDGITDADSYLRISSDTVRLNNVPLQLFHSGNQTVDIGSTNGSVKLGTDIGSDATTSFDFNGATGALSIKGSLSANDGDVVANNDGLNLIVFTGGSSPTWSDWGKALTFTSSPSSPSAGNTVGQIFGHRNSTSFNTLNLETYAGTTAGVDDASVRIWARRDGDANKFAAIVVENDNSTGGGVEIYAANGSGVLGNITMFGNLRTADIEPLADNTSDLGASGARYYNAYITNLHVGTIVGTPSYSHSHIASEIVSGTFDLARIPATLTGKDADTLDGYHASAFALAGGGVTSIVAGGGIGVSGTSTVTVSHSDTSSVGNIDNSGGTVIQDLTFDTYGHVTAAASVNLDSRYAQALTQGGGISITGALSGYTVAHSDTSTTGDVANSGSTFIQSMTFDTYGHVTGTTSTNITTALDSVYVNVSGDTMTGNLFIDADQASGSSVALGFVSNSSGNAGWRFNVRAHDYSVVDQRNDLVIARFDGTVSTNMLYFDYATLASTFGGSVTASGAGSFGADTEVHSYLGRAAIGYAAAADSATFAHYDHYTSTNFGFAQFSNGSTAVNAVTGQEITLSINDVATYSVNADRLLPRGSVAVDLGDYNRKIRTIHAAELAVQTLIAQDVIATVGGQIIVSPTSRLIADISSTGTPGGADAIYTNLISYWSLDEVSGTRLDSKSTNHLADRNTVTSTTGKVGVSAVFNKANSERLNIADNAALSVGDIDFYLAGWVYATSDDGTVQCVASKAGGANNRAWELEIDWAGSTNRFEFTVYNSSNATTQVASAAISTNTWYFVEIWHNATSNQIGLAVNRTQTTAAHTTGVKDETGNFTLGASNSGTHYTGRLDEWAYWKNYIPDTTRRDWLYNSGNGRTYTEVFNYGAAAFNFDLEHNFFDADDFVYMAAAPGGIQQIEVFKITSAATEITGGWRYTAERNLSDQGQKNWYAGDAVASLGGAVGEGYINLTATSTIHDHFGPTIAHYVRRGTGAWDSIAPVVASGNLRSFVDYTGDEFGHAAGNDLLLTPEEGFKGYTIDTVNGMRTFNVDISLYDAETRFLTVGTIGGIKIETNDSSNNDNRSISFDQLGVTRAYIRTASEMAQNTLLLRTVPTTGYSSIVSVFADADGSDTATATLRAGSLASGETYIQAVQSPTANSSFVDLVSTGEIRVRGDMMVMSCGIDVNGYNMIDAGSLTMLGDIDLNGNDIIDIGTFGETFTSLSYGSGWVNFGGGFQNAGYKKAGDLVILKGLTVRTSGSSTTIGTLPSGYRPSATCVFVVASGSAFGEVRIATTGVISLQTGSATTWVSLDGIVFSTL